MNRLLRRRICNDKRFEFGFESSSIFEEVVVFAIEGGKLIRKNVVGVAKTVIIGLGRS